MTAQSLARLQLACAGALGGGAIWALIEAADKAWLAGYPALVLTALVLTLMFGLFAMAGPLGLWRALARAVILALAVAGLVALTALRYSEAGDFFHTPYQALAVLVVATLPVPFLIASARGGPGSYPALFLETWAIVLRLAAAGAFTGLVWLVLLVSDEVLRIVGVDVIGRLLGHDVVSIVLTGAILGLASAVVYDLADLLSPYVVLRLFRLFLPGVLVVMAIFLVALPFRGLEGLVSGLSPALLLLVMVAGGVSLVSIAIDQSDAEATDSPLIRRATQAMAVLLPVFAGLALHAVWLRVADHGWSPDRVFVAVVALSGLGYGLSYALAVLRGLGWQARIRQSNIRLAQAVVVLAALWLTPVLNAERIAAGSQLARFEAGTTPVEALDVAAIRQWGLPGAAAIATLETQARAAGQERLAAVLAGSTLATGPDPAVLAGQLAELVALQPPTATGTRDTLLAAAAPYQLQDWLQVCAQPTTDSSAACVMVVAELLPLQPGEEAMLFLARSPDYVEIAGLYLGDDGSLQVRAALRADGRSFDAAAARGLMQTYRTTSPPVTAALLNQLGTGETGLLILP
jgi:Domain of unknown function (DUF4153)